MNPEFLDVDDILAIHSIQLGATGGSEGLRDRGLLEAAVAQPRATFGGEFLHEDLFAMAAAYLFHIAKDHAFVDGNKRAALVAALTFLDVNGSPIMLPDPRLFDLADGVAASRIDKEAAASTLREIAGQG